MQQDFQAIKLLLEVGANENARFGDTINILGLSLLSENVEIIQEQN